MASLNRAAKFLLIWLELCLILVIVSSFQIETRRHLLPVLCFIVVGFCIHAWLPDVRRLEFFAALSVACILFVLGFVNGLLVLVIGGVLMGIGYLPIKVRWRIGVLMIAGAALVFGRVHYHSPIWPIVGSMFMFRLAIFIGECRSDGRNPSIVSAISYFFMLPNACFPLFPIVDYKTFCATRYQENEWEIYQRGVAWIVRGLTHLLLYRAIKSYLVPDLYELSDVTRIAVFVATNYALYLQVSGHFHLITGLLHLFGFNLPPTHNSYFLAESFSDIWRRINIYWKDFLSKFVFYPAFYAIRGRGASANQAMVLSVFLVFVCTWLFHSWQTFWLLGRFPVTVNDACLWLGAGSLVAVNSIFDSRRRQKHEHSALFQAFSRSGRTVVMFGLVSLFWSCWTKPGFLSLVADSLHRPGAFQGILLIVFWGLGAVTVGTIVLLARQQWAASGRIRLKIDVYTSVKLHLAALGIVAVFALPGSIRLLDNESANVISEFLADPTIAQEAGGKLQSYYEDLNMATIQAGPMLSAFSPDDSRRRAQAEGFLKVSRPADLYQGLDLIPGIRTELDGSAFSVNLFGMRDRDTVTFDKSQGTLRIAMVGSSIVMGYGVSDDEVFSRQFEDRLNQERGIPSRKFEVLNFGVGKQWAPHRLNRIQRKVLRFHPDAVYYFAHQDEFKELASHAAQLIAHRRELPSQHLKDVAAQAMVTPDMPPGEIQSRLARFETELLMANYRTIVDECRKKTAIPVWIYLPVPGGGGTDLREKLVPLAKSAGFIVCDLSGWTDDREDIFPSAEVHPNAGGHELIASALMRMVNEFPEALPK